MSTKFRLSHTHNRVLFRVFLSNSIQFIDLRLVFITFFFYRLAVIIYRSAIVRITSLRFTISSTRSSTHCSAFRPLFLLFRPNTVIIENFDALNDIEEEKESYRRILDYRKSCTDCHIVGKLEKRNDWCQNL